jgi:hypothetical protein
VIARREYAVAVVSLVVCAGTAFGGLATCQDESGSCPAWHVRLDAISVYGAGASLPAILCLRLAIYVSEARGALPLV